MANGQQRTKNSKISSCILPCGTLNLASERRRELKPTWGAKEGGCFSRKSLPPKVLVQSAILIWTRNWSFEGSQLADDENNDVGQSDVTRRDFIHVMSASVGAVATAAAVWPLIDQMNPAADVLALATTEVNLGAIQVGQSITVVWQGKPVFIRRRTQAEIEEARSVPLTQLKDPETDEARVQKAEWLIMVGVCTHLGCIPLGQQGEYDGWFCPCHGSHYDTSGRIRKGPAPVNLLIPPYVFLDANKILIG